VGEPRSTVVTPEYFDVCVIGGGLAGVSAAAELAAQFRVALLEQEPQLGYHASGRSAALYAQSYGNPQVRALTRASCSLYLTGDETNRLTQPRGVLFVGTESQRNEVQALYEALSEVSSDVALVDARTASEMCPMLKDEHLSQSLFDPSARDIDVAAVLDHYTRRFRARDGELRRNAEVVRIEPHGEGWHVTYGITRIFARVIVNAAGAWADSIARTAGVTPVGLQPLRRTAIRVVAAPKWRVREWPCVIDASEQWYFRPDAGALVLSPADETPSPPCDAQPDDFDVAAAIDRIESATRLVVDRPLSSWAGLRTFAPDRTPVVGFDGDAPNFFWLAGQGGYGIQMAPALAELTAALIAGERVPQSLIDESVDPEDLSPRRVRRGKP